MKTKINSLLLFLVLLDFTLATVGLFFPDFWIKTMHGLPVGDPLGLVRRLGAGWAAFFLFQLLALLKWRERPYWLVLVAGIRFTELFSDWVYLYFASQVTLIGKVGLFLSPPVNISVGWYLLSCFRRLNSAGKLTKTTW